MVRGWLSDEGCASGRANGGTYTGTNPDCAKKCVREGKRIVLVDPEHKRLLIILNGDAATERVGDYEVQFRVGSIELLGINAATRERLMESLPKPGEVFDATRLNEFRCVEGRRKR